MRGTHPYRLPVAAPAGRRPTGVRCEGRTRTAFPSPRPQADGRPGSSRVGGAAPRAARRPLARLALCTPRLHGAATAIRSLSRRSGLPASAPAPGPTASAAHQLVPHAPRAPSTTPPSAPPASTLLAAPAAPTVASATDRGEVHEPPPTRAGQLAPPPSARGPRRAAPTRGNRMENRRPHGAGRPAPSIVAAATPPRGAAGPLGDGAARPPSVAAGPPPSHHANSPAAARVAPLAAAKLAPERTGSTYGLHRPPPPSARPPWPLPPRTTRSRGAGTAAPRSPSAARCSPLRLTPLCAPHLPAAGALLRPSAAAVARGEPDP